MKVLVADDNLQMRDHLTAILDKEGFQTIAVDGGEAALAFYKQERPDFICLDVMMPDLSGYDVCKVIRQEDAITPIIFITSKSDSVDKVVGLDMGADDYIVKPFEIHEVLARIRAITRRCLALQTASANSEESGKNSFQMQDVTVYPQQLRAGRGSQMIELSLRETKILKLLFDNKNTIVDRDMLLDHCWGEHIMPESRTVDWHIAQLRKSVEIDPKEPKIIQTVRGVGYKFEE